MASADIKGFFRQKKGGVSKKPSSSSSSKKNSGKSILRTAAHGSPDSAQAAPLITCGKLDLQADNEDSEEKLRQFDMEMRYGPCVGLSRLERWDRACSMGLNPPMEIGHLLRSLSGSNPKLECLWEGRV
ncbi:DNA polymerase delta subunit 4 [Phalaenopsis equestris]|uniref:DNA polymerase delta subunit 4 n=1 Tax=Phalaenopsis equestris TaxID=78828 RepID=UPI0009E6393F|nr:DNA polymerase delta subunit 4 [Phalaenopsis equestris]